MMKTYLLQKLDKKTFQVEETVITSLDEVFANAREMCRTHHIQVVDQSNGIYFKIESIW